LPASAATPVSRSRIAEFAFALLVVAYCLYAGWFIYRTSFIVDGERFFSLFDDAMISMRYAENLTEGRGLVWNVGERVEGFTNLLWVLWMALVHLLPLGKAKMSLAVQATSAVLLLVNLFYIRRIAEEVSGGSRFAGICAASLTAFHVGVNNWALQGMEVGLLVLLVSIAVWHALWSQRVGRVSPLVYLALGTGLLVRLDMAVAFLVVWGCLLITDTPRRRTHFVYGFSSFVVFLGAETLFRWLYFGDLLPNTYYLKMTGYPAFLRMSHGLYEYLHLLRRTNWVLYAAPLAFAFLRRETLLLAAIFVAQSGYSVYVGGDAWEWWTGPNRYLSVGMPMLLVLLACMLERMRSGAIAAWTNATPGRQVAINLAAAAFAFVSLASLNTLHSSATEWLRLRNPLHVEGNRNVVDLAFRLRELTTDEASIAVVWAGAIPYFSERRTIDLLGKSDHTIARLPMRLPEPSSRRTGFLPGHMKWDYRHSIGRLEPDVVVQLWHAEEARPFLDGRYRSLTVGDRNVPIYLRRGSRHVRWNKVDGTRFRWFEVDSGHDMAR
jgi:hypothetical protein